VERGYESRLNHLNNIYLAEGPSAKYRSQRTELMETLLAYKTEPKSEIDTLPYQHGIIWHALEKNCLIYYADYEAFQTPFDHYDFRKKWELASQVYLPDIDAGDALNGALQYLKTSSSAYFETNLMREFNAVLVSLHNLGRLAAHESPYVPHTDEGQVPSSTIYGINHVRSLPSMYRQQGVEPKITSLFPAPEFDLFPSVDDRSEFNNKMDQYLAHTALFYATPACLQNAEIKNCLDQAYESLAFLTTAEEVEELLVTCANISREHNRDPENGREWFISLLGSLVTLPPEFARRRIFI
jgi:hypothetical protein